ncbi:MAG: hypothetical protein MUO19_06625 [Dehalococcoidales bacterium]|nr:hypothetical protein [Dehalococcoidales bacterium]
MEDTYGVPTAPIVTARFADYVQQDGRSHGMNLRWSFPPYPVGFVSREILQGYLEGNDPVSGAPLMEEVLFALTQPLTEAEKHPKIIRRPERPRLLDQASEDELHRLFLESGWTDGLPIVLPTEERVAEMLTGTDHDPQEIVGMMSVTTHEERLQYTVERVAVNAVMAGARPEHLPVILAMAATGQPSMPSSTTSWGSMVIVNGPVRDEIGMNSGGAALSPFNYANAVIGRAWTLMSINFGDARLGVTFTASTGHNANYNNMCCAENEESSPWEPFHVRKGFKAGESTVSMFRGWNVLTMGIGPAERMLDRMKGLSSFGGSFSFVVDPLVAKNLKQEGYDDPMKLSEWLVGKMESRFMRPEMVNFMVVGGETNPMWVATDFMYTRTVAIDPWIPKSGIRKDERPLRMPVDVTCSDGSCGISH